MRRLVWAAMGVALISMVFAGCEKEEEKEKTYMVQVTAAEGGTVEGQNGEYKYGETVVFTAVPVADYHFTQWSDGGTDNPRTINVYLKNVTLTAQFAQNPLLTISTSDNGTIETDVNGHYAIGSNVTVTAKPDADYFFAGWSDGNTDNPRTITIGNEDISLAALFAVLFFEPTVDLGLESSTLWASCNLGATKPWEYGDYYAWGETETKNNYSWETYKYCKGKDSTITKYCNNAECGFNGYTDTLTTLLPEDDAATAVLGTDYSMPTEADWEELDSQCYWVWTENYNNHNISGNIVYKAKSSGDKGTKVCSGDTPSASYSLSDPHIFLPTAGDHWETDLYNAGSHGHYWSASFNKFWPCNARFCGIYSSGGNPSYNYYRYVGNTIRPVHRP